VPLEYSIAWVDLLGGGKDDALSCRKSCVSRGLR